MKKPSERKRRTPVRTYPGRRPSWEPKKRRYTSDLSQGQWELLAAMLPRPKGSGGRPRTYPLREIVNGLLYVLRGGIAWRMMPNDLPPWQNVYAHFRRWQKDGTLERLHAMLREAVRRHAKKQPTPSLAIFDSQSSQTTESGGV